MPNESYGITSIGLAIPKLAIKLDEFAELRGTDPQKMTKGLGCYEMALCDHFENVVTLGIQAAKRALSHWDGNTEEIGLVAVATESSFDLSRPLSSWILESLDLNGPIRSYEIKHACYGGALALLQSIEWLKSTSENKVALIISTDVSLYAPNHPGEPTQGAGAVAFIVSSSPKIAEISPKSYPWSQPSYDFYRPTNKDYPQVNGQLSIECYQKGLINCFTQLAKEREELLSIVDEYDALTFHAPFYKMVSKSFKALGAHCNWPAQNIESILQQKISPSLVWNKRIGNAYTASLGFSISKALSIIKSGSLISAFSFGSGYGAELFFLRCIENQKDAPWLLEFESDFLSRCYIDKQEYLDLRISYDKNKSCIIDKQYCLDE